VIFGLFVSTKTLTHIIELEGAGVNQQVDPIDSTLNDIGDMDRYDIMVFFNGYCFSRLCF
jgi:hypothetical protein